MSCNLLRIILGRSSESDSGELEDEPYATLEGALANILTLPSQVRCCICRFMLGSLNHSLSWLVMPTSRGLPSVLLSSWCLTLDNLHRCHPCIPTHILVRLTHVCPSLEHAQIEMESAVGAPGGTTGGSISAMLHRRALAKSSGVRPSSNSRLSIWSDGTSSPHLMLDEQMRPFPMGDVMVDEVRANTESARSLPSPASPCTLQKCPDLL